MSMRTVWRCDGCDSETIMNGPSDWKRISITIDGFKGYPVDASRNGEWSYELCPECQRELARGSNPLQWTRSMAQAPSE